MASNDEFHEWVSTLLGASATVEMPEHIAARLEDALTGEAQQRLTHASLDDAKRSYLEMRRRSAVGTFGENAPSHYDKIGVGIDVHPVTHDLT